ncbi:MAG: hypothetical protein OSJ54_06090 [Oscillospiraceae bacterium]|nr:hypothetical protein [Oscillospiraceae bacterium]
MLVYILCAAGGVVLGCMLSLLNVRRLKKRIRALRGNAGKAVLRSVTRLIFLTTQISALMWVFTSYAIAIYSTVYLQQVYTMSELSEPAINTILGVSFLKVLENVFEHNEGAVFGKSKETKTEEITEELEENMS